MRVDVIKIIIVKNVCVRIDSYIGMDQQQDMKLDVKEAAAVPAEHPQWDISDSDTDNNDQVRFYTLNCQSLAM